MGCVSYFFVIYRNVPAPPKRIINTPMILQHAKGPILDADSEKAKIIVSVLFLTTVTVKLFVRLN